MVKKRENETRRGLSLMMVLMAMLFGLALFMPGEDAYASQQQQQQQQGEPSTDPKIRILKLDQNSDPVKGATMELWRIQIPEKYNYYYDPSYQELLDMLKDNEKIVERVDRWVTDGKEHMVDLSKYYPSDYSRGSATPYNFVQYDDRYYNYNYGYYPFCYMLIETDTPGNYMTAAKTFFRVDPEIYTNSGNLYSYEIRYYDGDPRQSRLYAGHGSSVTLPITAVDTKAPLLVDKLDQYGRHVKGAELELLDDKGNPVMGTDGKPVKWTSSGKTDQLWIKRPSFPDADATEHGGGPVDYTIHEIKAPEGYDKSKDVTFKLYPCGKWDYAEGSEPATGHKPTVKQTPGANCNDPLVPEVHVEQQQQQQQQQQQVPEPCPPAPSGPTIPYVYTDPVRVIDFKVKTENGIEVGDFTINKMDQDGQPLSEVAFAVYGKPKLTTTINVDVKKHWEYEGATRVTETIGPDEHAFVSPPEQHVEQQQEAQVPEVNSRLPLLKPEDGEKSFPYDYMANLTPKVTVKDGVDVVSTLKGTPLKDILGDAFDKAQNNGERTAGTYYRFKNYNGDTTTLQGEPHWYFQGSADEDLGTFSLKEGDTVVVGEELEGSLAGETALIQRQVTYSGYDYETDSWSDNLKRTIRFINAVVGEGGVGWLQGLDVAQYNNYDKRIPTNVLRYFHDYGEGVSGNLVRHLAPEPVRVEFSKGKLYLTDETGTHDITDSCEIVLNNVVQWRTEGVLDVPQQEQQQQE